jgi:hypothetical protein
MMRILAALLFTSLLSPAWAQVDTATRQKLLRQFEQKNQAKKEKREAAKNAPLPDAGAGLDQLKQALADARLALLSDRSEGAVQRAAQATLNYAEPLLRAGQVEEAISVLKTSLDMGAKNPDLVRLLAQLRFGKTTTALEKGEWDDARVLLDTTWREARAYGVEDVEKDCAERLRALMFNWASQLFHEGDLTTAKDKAIEATTWRTDNEPIQALIGRIDYLRDNYHDANEYLTSALRGEMHNSPYLVRLAEVMRLEQDIEENYSKAEMKGLTIISPHGLAIDEKGLERAFAEARVAAQSMFGITTPLPVRLSLYQRNDFEKFTHGPEWSVSAAVYGKLRVRLDAVRGGIEDQNVVARYLYGLWVLDTLSDGHAPAWFLEGAACQLAYPRGPANGGIHEITKRLTRNAILPFKDLELPFAAIPDRMDAAVLMAQSQSAIQLLFEKAGLDSVKRLAEAYWSSASTEDALREAAGFGYDDFFREWVERAGQAFLTNPAPDQATLRALGQINPMGSYWDQ